MESPPVIDPLRRRPSLWLNVALPGAALAGVVVVLFLFNPSHYGFYPRCLLFRMTGIYCPGCGGLRAVHELVRGHLLTAMHDNLPFVLSLPFFGVFALRWIRCWRADLPLPRCVPSPGRIKVIVVTLLVFTLLRNIPCAPFNWLAPVG